MDVMRKGLTLVEMLVVLAIVGILLSIGGYNIFAHRRAEAWRAEISSIEGLLKTGSQVARSSGRPVQLVVSGSTAYLSLEGQPLYITESGKLVAPHLRVNLSGTLESGGRTSGALLLWRPSGRVEGERIIRLSDGSRSFVFTLTPWGELEMQ